MYKSHLFKTYQTKSQARGMDYLAESVDNAFNMADFLQEKKRSFNLKQKICEIYTYVCIFETHKQDFLNKEYQRA
jgi:hypothetical protein